LQNYPYTDAVYRRIVRALRLTPAAAGSASANPICRTKRHCSPSNSCPICCCKMSEAHRCAAFLGCLALSASATGPTAYLASLVPAPLPSARPPTVAASSSSRARLLRFQAEAAQIQMRPRLRRLFGGGRRLAPPPPSAATDGGYLGRRGLRGTAALAGGELRQTRPLPPVLPSLVGGGLLRAWAGDADPRCR
jgi:hypothetical protein